MCVTDWEAMLALIVSQYSDRHDCVISADEAGFVEYWQPSDPFELPRGVPDLWQYKSQTDLYEFKKVWSKLLSSNYLLMDTAAVKVDADMYHSQPRFLVFRHFLAPGPSNTRILFPDWQDDAKV